MAQCAECLATIPERSSKGQLQSFCSPEHSKRYHNRKLAEGAALVLAAKAWAMSRHPKTAEERAICSAALSELTRIAGTWNARDKKEERGSAAELFARTFGVFEEAKRMHGDTAKRSAKARATRARRAASN